MTFIFDFSHLLLLLSKSGLHHQSATTFISKELQILDKFEQDYLHKRQKEDNSFGTQKGDSLAILKADMKSQRKQVMEKLVDIVHYLILEIHCAFGSNEDQKSPEESESGHQRLGPVGLALYYVNIILQVDTLTTGKKKTSTKR
ncbi:hypothetical protein GOBAR_DD09217 [Gossypium barbadense]|nr:hypothetical protein GOBAR_DD09217 [Gossypium barbadense]